MDSKEMAKMLRKGMAVVSKGSEAQAYNFRNELVMAGFVGNQWEGDSKLKAIPEDKEPKDYKEWERCRIMEWYAGQIIAVVEHEAWFAVNSLVNTTDKFAKKEWTK